MNFQFITKKIVSFFFLGSLFLCNTTIYAEPLAKPLVRSLFFKAGDKASYKIFQKADFEIDFGKEEFLNGVLYRQLEETIVLDIEILSSNQQTFSYPFDVKVTLRKLLINNAEQHEESSEIMKYDSSVSEISKNRIEECFDKLINYSLIFRLEKEFEAKENTGRLDQFYKEFNALDSDFTCITLLHFDCLFAQLFHLSGENLLLSHSYPVSYPVPQDRAYDEDVIWYQDSAYRINAIKAKKIESSWQGNVKLASPDWSTDTDVSFVGNVIWDIANPMIQKRDLDVQVDVKIEEQDFFKMSLQQIVESTPLIN